MIKFLIATHGNLADGFKSTIGVIMGEEIKDKISALNCFVGDTPESDDVKTVIRNYFENLGEDEEVIVFTDILHGSVNQLLIPYVDNHKVYILTGVNLPLMCEVMALYGFVKASVDMDDLREFISTARNEILFVNDYAKERAKEHHKNDEDSFFE